MKKTIRIVILLSAIALSVRLFCGVYVHEEYGDDVFFIKKKPTWKWHFYSPIGMTDLELKDLTPEQQQEQKDFNEFVGK